MCRNRNYKKDPQSRFISNVKSFLIVNAVFVFLAFKGSGAMTWWWLPAFIWGISLLNQYYELRRNGDEPRFLAEPPKDDHYWQKKESPKEERPRWSEKDLV
jgi:hypothetical protein